MFKIEQMVPPGFYWHVTAAYASVGIKCEPKRDFAT